MWDQTAIAAALIVAQPSDQTYAFTENSIVGVDPAETVVPSLFISVLVEQGTDRAPDRLVEAWTAADQDASTIAIRDIDDGANTAVTKLENVVLIFLGVAVAVVVIVAVLVIRSRRQRASTPSGKT